MVPAPPLALQRHRPTQGGALRANLLRSSRIRPFSTSVDEVERADGNASVLIPLTEELPNPVGGSVPKVVGTGVTVKRTMRKLAIRSGL
jgi:hypothetical protein